MRPTSRPALVLSLPLVWGVRNALRSGLAERLSAKYRLIFAVPPEGRDGLRAEGVDDDSIWLLDRPDADRASDWALQVLRRAHRRRCPTASDEIFDRWNGRSSSFRRRFRGAVFGACGALATKEPLFGRLEAWEQRLFTRRMPSSLVSRVARLRPVLALSTSCVIDWERPLFEALRRCGVPTATHILSFDNLTSRGFLPLRHFERYFVWQERMAGELQSLYRIPEEQIVVTGTPQFDFHIRPEYRCSRDETARMLGIDPSRPYIAYCANHFAITPNEPELVAHLIESLRSTDEFREYQWVVRLHPMDRYRRWQYFRQTHPEVAVSLPWNHNDESSHWAVPSADEIAQLGNTLRHAAVTLTVASTAALDSAVVGTPVVCVGFHPRRHSPEDRFYREAHWSHHYRRLVESGAFPVATSVAEVLTFVREALACPPARAAARAKLVRDICGPVDGRAAERLATAIDEIAAQGAG